MSDLRESGSIEQDADLVIFLYRPEYYNLTEDESGHNVEGIAEVRIAKHRNGSLDTVKLKFIAKFTKFTDLEDNYLGLGGLPDLPGSLEGKSGIKTFGSKANGPKDPKSGKDSNKDSDSPF